MPHIDIVVLTKAKLNNNFSTAQFLVNGVPEPYKKGLMTYTLEHVPSKLLGKHVFPNDMKALFFKLNFRNCKWLRFGTKQPTITHHKQIFIYLFIKSSIAYLKLLRKGIMKRSYLEIYISKKTLRTILKKLKKTKKLFSADSIEKREKTFLIS